MTHVHIPDGILPVVIWLPGILLMAAALAVSLVKLRSSERLRNVPLLGAISACMLVTMSLEILPLAYHVNLSVVAGILLGPALGFLAAFVTNLMLALIGHGGITVIGLNTLLLGSETVLGHVLYYLFLRRMSPFWSAASATILTLFLTTMTLVGIVAAVHIDPELLAHDHAHAGDAGNAVKRFAFMVITLGSIGWVIESAVSGTVVKFIAQVKPDLLRHALHKGKAAGDGR